MDLKVSAAFVSCLFGLLIGWSLGEEKQEMKDTREGEDVTLECRFPPQLKSQNPSFYWLRVNRHTHDNVAIEQTPLDNNYRLDFRPEQGKYDLLISNASYERDNGRFECRAKAPGSGTDLHSQSFVVTVLTPPGPPRISPAPNTTATEGKPLELACSSAGGSPDPLIRWYREGIREPLETATHSGKDGVTSAILSLSPKRDDDGAIFRCVVWNRAMPESARLETKLTLNVNYFPRVEVGPEPVVRVEREGTVTLQCNVDAKPRVSGVRWTRNGRFVATSFTHTLRQVTSQDAGKYTCTADNGLGQSGEAEITLDVQYGPQVTIQSGPGVSRQRDVEEGESVVIHCNVSANPAPTTVEWLREGRPEFRQSGETLVLQKVSADSAGTYTCRAVNVLNPTSLARTRTNKVGNASITLLVRHHPGQARITPDRPIATEGAGVTLTCSASPPGWPMPTYRWWRESDQPSSSSGSAVTILATGSKYTIPSAHIGSEGKYLCQAMNEKGNGDIASVILTVHQPPRFLAKLQPHVTRRVGDSEFSAMCGAQGKPKPSIKWFKDGAEISPKLFDISTTESEGENEVYTVHSTLRFSGRDRPNGNELIPFDRGVYSCIFENEVKRAETSMHLRIEHEPIVLHKYNKVAYDLRETAQVICKVQAYPRPEFQWSYSTHTAPLLPGSDGHYEINTTVNEAGGDVYTSILQVSNLRELDYGDYNCRIANALGNVRTTIQLQPKGAPEKPESVTATQTGHNYITLKWVPGFDGGLQNTKYFVSYKKVHHSADNDIDSDCYASRKANTYLSEEWQEFDCQRSNPCNVTALEQHQTYVFKMKAYNSKGHSDYSEEAYAMTKVDRIPAPQRVTFNPETLDLTLNIAATCLQLVGVVEATTSQLADPDWHIIETLHLEASGSGSSRQEATISSLASRRASTGRSLDDPVEDQLLVDRSMADEVRVRVRLCLRSSQDTCGDYTEAEIGPSYVKEASTLPTPTIIAIVVSCVVFLLFIGLLYVFCRCKSKQCKKGSGKDYEMDSSVHPSIVQQAPPPYYPASGMENKALEHSLDLALDDQNKYVNQNEYGYHTNAHGGGQHPNGVNMAYMENSYSNSNNGGSVNSQDSLWQMKMQAANSPAGDHHHHIADRTNHYGGYDPLTHGGYGTVDDYAPYPHLTSQTPDYGSNAPSRQDYAAPNKAHQGHLRSIDSPYHDVSGLPDPYMDHQLMDSEENLKPQQHLSMSFDESLESGYSTPNSRNRRIIREIIV
ncbi:unnamed protein product [Bemisia tabaci]|uniref:Uncharacterized protein n=1 Tax=Bemisia tabaci TaxID=7038 RepID=A0A9P0CFN4_BEMTA|nr:unnamed protein product [Bemisia tabaci]